MDRFVVLVLLLVLDEHEQQGRALRTRRKIDFERVQVFPAFSATPVVG